jgi:hypothetical protein
MPSPGVFTKLYKGEKPPKRGPFTLAGWHVVRPQQIVLICWAKPPHCFNGLVG